jgi:hypothetical protein
MPRKKTPTEIPAVLSPLPKAAVMFGTKRDVSHVAPADDLAERQRAHRDFDLTEAAPIDEVGNPPICGVTFGQFETFPTSPMVCALDAGHPPGHAVRRPKVGNPPPSPDPATVATTEPDTASIPRTDHPPREIILRDEHIAALEAESQVSAQVITALEAKVAALESRPLTDADLIAGYRAIASGKVKAAEWSITADHGTLTSITGEQIGRFGPCPNGGGKVKGLVLGQRASDDLTVPAFVEWANGVARGNGWTVA